MQNNQFKTRVYSNVGSKGYFLIPAGYIKFDDQCAIDTIVQLTE